MVYYKKSLKQLDEEKERKCREAAGKALAMVQSILGLAWVSFSQLSISQLDAILSVMEIKAERQDGEKGHH